MDDGWGMVIVLLIWFGPLVYLDWRQRRKR